MKKISLGALCLIIVPALMISACATRTEPESDYSFIEQSENTVFSQEMTSDPSEMSEPVTEEMTETTTEPPHRDFPAQTVTSYPIFEGTDEENEVTVITSDEPGPVFYIIGGIHGNEPAGWKAANELKKELKLYCGTVYILSPVNSTGAIADTRYPDGTDDLNRAFPGDRDSSSKAKRMAAELFEDVKRISPDFVLDLHEASFALGEKEGKGIGNSIIYSDDELLGDVLFEFAYQNQSGELLDEKFGLSCPGVAKSFNRTVTDELGIPVVTPETVRTENLEKRISQEKEIAYFFMNYYGMTDLYKR